MTCRTRKAVCRTRVAPVGATPRAFVSLAQLYLSHPSHPNIRFLDWEDQKCLIGGHIGHLSLSLHENRELGATGATAPHSYAPHINTGGADAGQARPGLSLSPGRAAPDAGAAPHRLARREVTHGSRCVATAIVSPTIAVAPPAARKFGPNGRDLGEGRYAERAHAFALCPIGASAPKEIKKRVYVAGRWVCAKVGCTWADRARLLHHRSGWSCWALQVRERSANCHCLTIKLIDRTLRGLWHRAGREAHSNNSGNRQHSEFHCSLHGLHSGGMP